MKKVQTVRNSLGAITKTSRYEHMTLSYLIAYLLVLKSVLSVQQRYVLIGAHSLQKFSAGQPQYLMSFLIIQQDHLI